MFKRKIYLIKRRFQFKFISIVVAMIGVFCGLVILNAWLFINRHQVLFAEIPEAKAAVIDMVSLLMIILICFGVGLSLLALFLSHKVAGPLYRFEQVLDAMALGNLTIRSSIRKGDELVDFQDKLNQAISRIQNNIKKDKEKANDISKTIKELREKLKADPGALKDAESLGNQLKNIEETSYEIGKFFRV